MSSYEPYEMSNFEKIVKWAYQRAFFSGEKTLFNLSCMSDFEGYYGRASEAWEHQFTLIIQNPHTEEKLVYKGRTIDEVAKKALLKIDEWDKGKKDWEKM